MPGPISFHLITIDREVIYDKFCNIGLWDTLFVTHTENVGYIPALPVLIYRILFQSMLGLLPQHDTTTRYTQVFSIESVDDVVFLLFNYSCCYLIPVVFLVLRIVGWFSYSVFGKVRYCIVLLLHV